MYRALIFIGACLLPFVSAGPARAADEHRDRWEARPNALEIHAGFGTPVGYLGAMYDRVLWERWSAGFGLGVGSGRSGSSLHLAAGTRFRVIRFAGSAIYLGIDYSTGGWRSLDLEGRPPPGSRYGRESRNIVFAERVHWLQGSLGYELRTAAGFALRTYYGIAAMLNPDARRCADELSGRPCGAQADGFDGESIPVIGIAIGGATE